MLCCEFEEFEKLVNENGKNWYSKFNVYNVYGWNEEHLGADLVCKYLGDDNLKCFNDLKNAPAFKKFYDYFYFDDFFENKIKDNYRYINDNVNWYFIDFTEQEAENGI